MRSNILLVGSSSCPYCIQQFKELKKVSKKIDTCLVDGPGTIHGIKSRKCRASERKDMEGYPCWVLNGKRSYGLKTSSEIKYM